MGRLPVRPPPDEAFDGAGVRTLRCGGNFALRSGMDDKEPAHVGKTDRPGGREGRSRLRARARSAAHPS